MTVKELERVVTDHLIESTGIKEQLKNLNSKMNWVLTLISAAGVAILTVWMRSL